MYLTRLIYASSQTEKFSQSDIESMMAAAQANNPRLGLSGVLCFNRKFFLQCLEGPREQVNLMYNKIVADTRHRHVTLVAYAEIDQRFFGQWAMKYVPDNQQIQNLAFRFSDSDDFNPYRMTAASALAFLLALVEESET